MYSVLYRFWLHCRCPATAAPVLLKHRPATAAALARYTRDRHVTPRSRYATRTRAKAVQADAKTAGATK